MASPVPPDPYKALGVSKDASLATIKSAHRKLVLICHPDKFPDESIKAQKADEFHQVQRAYEILSDETKRQRYDERIKLAELRAELMKSDRGPPRRMASDFSPRTAGSTTFEMRGNVIFEERVPRPRAHDDEYFHIKYDDPRSPQRAYDDRSDYYSPKLHSPRVQEEKRRARERDEDRERERHEDERIYRARRAQEKERAAEKAYRSDKKKTRDKDRRRNSDTKYQYARVEDDTDTDSDSTSQYTTRRATEPKRRLDENRRREREDRPRLTGRNLESEDEDARYISKYVAKSGSRPPLDPASRRPSHTLPPTNVRQVPPPPTPPPSPPPSVDTARRSAASRRPRESSRTRSSVKERRAPEIVEPAGRSEAFRPKLPTQSSDPVHIRTPPSSPRNQTLPRAATMEPRRDEPKHPTLPRSATSPIGSMFSPREREPMRSSRLRNTETHDAGYSSPEHTVSSPRYNSTKYRVSEEDDDTRGHRVVPVEPEYFSHRDHDRQDREVSPKAHHRGSDHRPSMSARASTSARTPARSSSMNIPDQTTSSRQPLFRTESARPPPPSSQPSSKPLYREVAYSPKLAKEDISYASRPSQSSHRDRGPDDYPYHRHVRPGMGDSRGSFVHREAPSVR